MAHGFFQQVARPRIRLAPFPHLGSFEASHPIDPGLAALAPLHHTLVNLQTVLAVRLLGSVKIADCAFDGRVQI